MLAELNIIPTQTANYTANVGQLVQVNPTGGAFAVNLPNAKFCKGQSVIVSNVSTSTMAVTVTATHSQSINGASTLAMTTSRGTKTFVSDGTNWIAY